MRISDWNSDVCSSDLERFGPALRAWRDQRAISRSAKRAACIGMTVGYGLFCVSVRPSPLLAFAVAAGLAACAAYVLSRPQPRNGIRPERFAPSPTIAEPAFHLVYGSPPTDRTVRADRFSNER